MHPDDVDADENGSPDTPVDLGMNLLFGVTEDEDQVDNAAPPEPPGLDGLARQTRHRIPLRALMS